jgi:polyisoprenoid-binding protein YceI
MMKNLQFILAVGTSLALAASCTADDAQSAGSDTLTTSSTGAIAVEDASAGGLQSAAVRFVVAATGNEVRYRVREQLVGFDLPNDAIGKSASVSGAIGFDANGRVVPEASRLVIDASTFVSDRDRRDGYVRGRLLTAEQYPTIVFVPTEARGLTIPADSGTSSFDLLGNLTVRGVTRPTAWHATARFQGGRVSGTASTRFTFADFQMEKPRVRSVLSVADTIALEYDFNLVREATQSAR